MASEVELTSRRRLLRMGAIGVAAVGAAAVGNAMRATPAGAATGSDMIVGEFNEVTHETDLTQISGGSFAVGNDSHAADSSTIFADNTVGPGLLALAGGPYIGVEGRSLAGTPGCIGVKGTGLIGVQGVTNSSTVASGPGVLGVGNARGVGLQATEHGGCLAAPVPLWIDHVAGLIRDRPVHRAQ